MTISVKVPGKLYLAGEYAVVETGYPAVIAAVNRFLTVTIQTAPTGHLQSSLHPDVTVTFGREKGQLSFSVDHPYQLVETALRVAEEYVVSQGQLVTDLYRITIASELDDVASDKKYGLGSSGAVTVGVIKALLTYYDLTYSSFLLYQLATVAQTRQGLTGSFGDLAASSFGGVIAYYSLDRKWLVDACQNYELKELLQVTWPAVQVGPLQLPPDLELLVGWTGQVASTDQLVTAVTDKISYAEKAAAHALFVKESRRCVETLITACQQGQTQVFQESITTNRQLLQTFSQKMGLLIETPALCQQCQIAEEYGAVAKSSGAGGGDCGICFSSSQVQKQQIRKGWQQAGIEPLELGIA